jgi:phosphoglycerate dehydrogenase-like enzyme
MRIALLDDYQGVALAMADWSPVDAGIDVFTDHFVDPDALVRRHPLRRSRRTLLTPHLGYGTKDVYRTLCAGVVEDIVAFHRGAPIRVL